MKRGLALLLFAWAAAACGDKPPATSADALDAHGAGDAPGETTPPGPRSAISHGDGVSCDEAMAQNEARMGQVEASPETEAAVKKLLNDGAYLNRCNVPSSSFVEICAAILDGEVLGVTVELDPGAQAQADCVAGEIRMMEVPESAALIRASTQFEPSL